MESKIKSKIEVNFIEITAKATVASVKNNPEILGNATITLKTSTGQSLTISGFTIWKSKFEGFNITSPRDNRTKFEFCLIEKSLKEKIKKLILNAYDYASISTIDC